jgi:Uma2 family endonuclease
VDGRLVERHMGMESSRVAQRIGSRLQAFCDQNKSGLVFNAEAGYQCFPDVPDKVRKPDVSVVLAGRLPGNQAPEGHARLAPDLAVEVLSPNDLAYEVDEKVREYLDAGVKLVWVVNPRSRVLRIHRRPGAAAGRASELTSDDSVTGEDVLPGFTCPVRDFFDAL